MHIELTDKEFRRLLDMVYIGNWILNSTREDDRFQVYDRVESKLFDLARRHGMPVLAEQIEGVVVPSQAFVDGGIHEAILDYEYTVFYEILAEELARRDMNFEPINEDNFAELTSRMNDYIEEFEQNGVDNISLEN